MRQDSIPDAELIERLLARDRQAWHDFVSRFQGLICARIRYTAQGYRINLSESDIDDIAADVFAAVLANDMAALRQFEFRCSLATWLSMMTRRRCARTLMRIQRNDPQPGTSELPEVAVNDDPLQNLVIAENRDLVRESLDLLRDGDREVLTMYYLDEMGYQQISEHLGVSINTIGSKLHRAQNRLRKLMRWK